MTTQIKIWECFSYPKNFPCVFSQPKSTPRPNHPHPDSNLLQPDISFVCSSNSCQWNHTLCTLLFTFMHSSLWQRDSSLLLQVKVVLFCICVVLHWINIITCIYPFYWTFGLLPVWGCYEHITYKFLKIFGGSAGFLLF